LNFLCGEMPSETVRDHWIEKLMVLILLYSKLFKLSESLPWFSGLHKSLAFVLKARRDSIAPRTPGH